MKIFQDPVFFAVYFKQFFLYCILVKWVRFDFNFVTKYTNYTSSIWDTKISLFFSIENILDRYHFNGDYDMKISKRNCNH